MFVPKAFAEERDEVLHQAIRDIGVGTIVSHADGELIATLVPIEFQAASEGQPGKLRCHFAKPNPHARALEERTELLVIFQGPQAYVTPNWYPTKAEGGKVVPTWNYAAVHVYGKGQVYDDQAKLRRHLEALTDHFESGGEHPWKVSDAPDDFIDQLTRGIVGVEIEIDRMQGKWKMSQNRPAQDRTGVIEGLRQRGADADRAVADQVARYFEGADAS